MKSDTTSFKVAMYFLLITSSIFTVLFLIGIIMYGAEEIGNGSIPILIISAITFIITLSVIINASISKKKRMENIQKSIENLKNSAFDISKQVVEFNWHMGLLIDENNNNWALLLPENEKTTTYKFTDLVEYEIMEDNNSLIKGKIGSTIASGLLFGGLAALAASSGPRNSVSMCKNITLRIVVNNMESPIITIPILNVQTKKNSPLYKKYKNFVMEIAAIFAIIKERAEKEQGIVVVEEDDDNFDDLTKLHELKEKGIITEKEFELKKKDILNL